jgi:tryptophan halogenase
MMGEYKRSLSRKSAPYKFVVVGGGTAGAIVSTWLKAFWGDAVEVVVIYNHAEPNIGIGESLTPMMITYLDRVGIKPDDLVKHCNSTIKLGLKFKNWTGDGSYFYHPFYCIEDDNLGRGGFEAAYDLVNNQFDNDITYSNKILDENRVPLDIHNHSFTLHIDGVLTSKYILDRYKDELTIIDDIIVDITKDESGHIAQVIGNKGEYDGDFFIDATGFKKLLFKKLDNNRWLDTSDWLPLNRCIPNPIFREHKTIPVTTTSEATDNGWILQVPLRNRIGAGYLFSTEFTSDQEALDKFDIFLQENYDTNLSSDKIIPFESGYWHDQWIGNCMCVGLSSGFTEPLEATNVHHVIYQMQDFTSRFNFEIFQFDIDQYNIAMREFYDRVYLFLRYCYDSGRTDSDFWKYMTYERPVKIKNISDKLSKDFLNINAMSNSVFNHDNFLKVTNGHGKCDLENYAKILNDRSVMETAKHNSDRIRQIKDDVYRTSISHKDFIEEILCK